MMRYNYMISFWYEQLEFVPTYSYKKFYMYVTRNSTAETHNRFFSYNYHVHHPDFSCPIPHVFTLHPCSWAKHYCKLHRQAVNPRQQSLPAGPVIWSPAGAHYPLQDIALNLSSAPRTLRRVARNGGASRCLAGRERGTRGTDIVGGNLDWRPGSATNIVTLVSNT